MRETENNLTLLEIAKQYLHTQSLPFQDVWCLLMRLFNLHLIIFPPLGISRVLSIFAVISFFKFLSCSIFCLFYTFCLYVTADGVINHSLPLKWLVERPDSLWFGNRSSFLLHMVGCSTKPLHVSHSSGPAGHTLSSARSFHFSLYLFFLLRYPSERSLTLHIHTWC